MRTMRNARVSTNQGGGQRRARLDLGSRILARSRALAALSATIVLAACGGGDAGSVATVTPMTNIAVTVSPRRAGVTTSEPQQFAATLTNTTSTAVSWGVDGIVNGSALVGTITNVGLYAPPNAAGIHTVTATSTVDPTKTGSSTVAVTDLAGVYTRDNDVARTGQNLQEYALTPKVVGASGNFGKLFQCKVDGTTYAQPLYVANFPIANGVHNVVFVATEHDSVYAFDADASSCVTYWHVSFLNGATVTTVPPAVAYNSTVAAVQDIATEIGITGTPVINATENTLYVVAKTQETDASNNVTYHDRLHALSLATGNEQANSPVDITAAVPTKGGITSFVSILQNQRAGLLLSSYSSGTAVYIAWSSYGDVGAYHGWVIAYDAATLAQVAAWNDTPNGSEGGIWMAGGGVAADSSGALYLSTGNGSFDDSADIVPPNAPNNDFGESFVKLNQSTLAVADYYTPAQNAVWSANDLDLASSGVTVLPDGTGPTGHPNVFIGSDKQAHLWLMDRDLMSRFSPTSDNTVQYLLLPGAAACAPSAHCVCSTPAFYNGTVYIGMSANAVIALPLTNGLFSASGGAAVASSASTEVYQYPGPTPMISASPAGNAILWVLDAAANGTSSNGPYAAAGPAVLRAYDATNLATTLYSSSALAGDVAGNAVKFIPPVVANGKVYVGGDHALTVYGLLP
jgi:hypothetical protein